MICALSKLLLVQLIICPLSPNLLFIRGGYSLKKGVPKFSYVYVCLESGTADSFFPFSGECSSL